MAQIEEIRLAVLMMVRCLVDKPDEVTVETVEHSKGMIFRIYVACGNIGQVIGRQGRTALSLRILTAAAGVAAGVKINLDIPATAAVVPLDPDSRTLPAQNLS
jgi:predicted RNA-binding protein YlqC (UPF0109 family)